MALGGSLLSGDSDEVHGWLEGLALILERRASEGSTTAIIVVGGGAAARRGMRRILIDQCDRMRWIVLA